MHALLVAGGCLPYVGYSEKMLHINYRVRPFSQTSSHNMP